MTEHNTFLSTDEQTVRAVERIYHKWDDALGRKDLDASMQLYAMDTTLESPLVRHLRGGETGIVHGRDDLRRFVETVFDRTPPIRRRHRTAFFTDGKTLIWEYPRVTQDGEQMDLVEVMDVKDGLIQQHRVYWGWLSVKVLEDDEYRRG
jgi:ketosteroid isomerase-like protein